MSDYIFLIIPIFAWFSVQFFKFLADAIANKRLNFRRIVETGGMPSSHSAVVTSLMTAIGIAQGASSPMFALSFVFGIIVMYDAAGVRRAAGKQAAILNELINSKQVTINRQEKLKELLGHTPIEVFFGAVYGVILACLFLL